MHNLHPEVFRLYNNLTTKLDKKVIHNLLFWKKKLPEENKSILDNIIKQYNDIYELLTPMMKLGITFDLWLVGGSVRDLLLGKGSFISDLDIMITFSQQVQPNIPKASDFIKRTKLDFNKEQIKPFVYRNNSDKPFEHWKILEEETLEGPLKDWEINKKKQKTRIIALFDMLLCCLSQKLDLYEIYNPKIEDAANNVEMTERYVDHRIKGVIKIRKDDWKWPVDIIMSEYHVNDFIESFDFGICKVAIELLRGSDIREQRKISSPTPKSLMTRVRLNQSFINDYKSKELNMNVSPGMTLRQVKHSVEKHLPKLETKYAWPVNVWVNQNNEFDELVPQPSIPVIGNSIKMNTPIKEDIISTYLESFFLARQLEKKLERKEFEIKKKVNKI